VLNTGLSVTVMPMAARATKGCQNPQLL